MKRRCYKKEHSENLKKFLKIGIKLSKSLKRQINTKDKKKGKQNYKELLLQVKHPNKKEKTEMKKSLGKSSKKISPNL